MRDPARDALERRIRRVRADRALARLAAGVAAIAAALLFLFGAVLGVGRVQGPSPGLGLLPGDVVVYARSPSSYGEGDVVLVDARRSEGAFEDGAEGDLVKRIASPPPGQEAGEGRYWVEGASAAIPRAALDGKVVLTVRVPGGAGDA